MMRTHNEGRVNPLHSGPNFTRLADTALAHNWTGRRLLRVVRIFQRFDEPMPTDLYVYASLVLPHTIRI